MKSRKLFIFFILTLAVILAAGITSRLRAPQSTFTKQVLFPDLAGSINSVAGITVKGQRRTVVLQQEGDRWVLASADNYPALFNKVKENVVGMAELRIADEKTDKPEFYSRLGVEGPRADGSKSLLVSLRDRSGQIICELIIGHRRQSSSNKPGLYVRKPDSARALLVEGFLDVSDRPSDWFASRLFDIPTNRVQEVRVSYPHSAANPGEDLVISKDNREQSEFTINIPDLEKESSAAILATRMSRGLEEMRADNVQSLRNFVFPDDDSITTTVRTFDGLVVTARLAEKDQAHYANFSFAATAATGNPGETQAAAASAKTIATEVKAVQPADTEHTSPAAEAEMLNKNYSAWVYEIPDFIYEALTMRPEQFRKLKLLPDQK